MAQKLHKRALVPLRRLTQLVALGVVALTGMLHTYSGLLAREAFRKEEASPFWTWLHGLRGINDMEPSSLTPPFEGHFWAFSVFGVDILDPLAAVETVLTTGGSATLTVAAGVLLPVVLTASLGRVFCGWVCPMNLLLEINDKVRGMVTKVVEPLPLPRTRLVGLSLLVGGLVVSLVTGGAVLGLFYPPAAISRLVLELTRVSSPAAAVALGVVLGIVALELFTVRRYWCRYVCPGGLLYSGIGALRRLRVRRDPVKCTGCRTCIETCQFDQKPMLDLVGIACTNCGDCVARCPYDALSLRIVLSGEAAVLGSEPQMAGFAESLSVPSAPKPASGRRNGRASEAPRAAKSVVVLAFLASATALLSTTPAEAHHVLGRPHYSYSEAYPQLTSYEIKAHGEGHQIVFTAFPGYVETGEATRLISYITTDEGELYEGEVLMGVTWRHPYKGDERIVPLKPPVMDSGRGRIVHTFDEEGEYLVDVLFYPHGPGTKPEHLEFPMSVGAAGVNVAWPVSAGAGLVLLLIVVGVLRKRRKKGSAVAAKQTVASAAMFALVSLMALAAPTPSRADVPPTAPDSAPASQPDSAPDSQPMSMPTSAPASMPASNPDSQPGEDSAAGHVMPGVPPGMAYGSIIAIMLFTFVGFEVFSRRTAPVAVGTTRRRKPRARRRTYPTFDLFRLAFIKKVLASRVGVFALRAPMIGIFVLLIVAGIFGVQHAGANIAPVMTWTLWWILLVMVVLSLGKAWCTVCPWDGIADIVRRLVPWRKTDEFTLGLRWPKALRNIYPALVLFILLTWLELAWGVTKSPQWTAWLGIAMLVLAVAPAVLTDKKSFCRYGCLVGRISGLYSLFAPVEVRSKNLDVCATCTSRACFKGTDGPGGGYACPTGQKIWSMTRNTYCTMCMECTQSCPHDNIALNVRPFGTDLYTPGDRRQGARTDEAIMALTMLSLSSFHGLTMTPSWWVITDWLMNTLSVGYVVAFTIGMAGSIVAVVALYAAFVWMTQVTAGTGSFRELFIQFSYPLIPIALFYHLAHNAMHFFMEAQHVVPLLSDPFGWGWDLFGTAQMTLEPMLSLDAVWIIQIVLVVVGHLFSLFITHRVAPRVLVGGRTVWGQVPLLVLVIAYSLISIWLVAQPMEMRTSM